MDGPASRGKKHKVDRRGGRVQCSCPAGDKGRCSRYRVGLELVHPSRRDFGFGGGLESPFHDVSTLVAVWQDPNFVLGEAVWVAEMGDRIVGCVTVEDRGCELELVNISVPLELQGRGLGTLLVRSLEERAMAEGKRAVTLGTSRNAEGVAWKSLPWWQHLGYRITHEEENDWTRSIGPGVREVRMRKDLPAV